MSSATAGPVLLSECARGRDNNFNLIRFVAATLVLYSHCYVLAPGGGRPEPLARWVGMTLSSIAVDAFFVTSGFLVAGSLVRRGGLVPFALARALRIYPALVGAALFCVLVIGPAFTTLPIGAYLASPQTHDFLWRNVTLFWGVRYDLPGVFADVRFAGVVNGSLWTLPYEVKLYALLGLLGALFAGGRRWLGPLTLMRSLMVAGGLAVAANVANRFVPVVAIEPMRVAAMFMAGCGLFAVQAHVRLSGRFFVALLAGLPVATVHDDAFFVAYCLALPYLLVYVAYVPSGRVRRFNRLGDYSYGMYIYAFPLQQAIAALWSDVTVSQMMPLAFLGALGLAISSWHFVEKRALRYKDGPSSLEDGSVVR